MRAFHFEKKQVLNRNLHVVLNYFGKWPICYGMDTLNVDIKKIESDYFNPRINGLDKLYQEIPTEQQNIREYTQDKDTLDNVKLADRLDPTMLDPFKDNPYTHSLASFAY